MRENNAGLKSNLENVDNHEISRAEYEEIPELPNDFFTKGQLYKNGSPVERRGRGAQKQPTKQPTTIRLNPDIIAFFKKQGRGWQTEINDVLQTYVTEHKTQNGEHEEHAV